ncbi:hypothetical protein SAMN05216420_11640 [Nitrosospira sp. Nl5]|uniref:hypothetical protein n=1 Tax=Nitrosospira sp. Nl5 TaxID=200120 RepID=UPI00088ABA11|nr:hypothetical protein [Nitrosospira sp. Nl5]SCY74931.1 hypothetical protein SAMN05216420_11640 [Nitrosospira sp. Nl5]
MNQNNLSGDAKLDIPTGMALYSKEEFGEIVSQLDGAIKDSNSMTKILESEDLLASAVKEKNKLAALVTVLEERHRGMQNEAREAKRLARYWRDRYENLMGGKP